MATAGSSSDGRLDVAQLLAQRAASSGRPSIEVEKEDDLEYDLAHLAAFDPAPLSAEALSADAEAHLLETARDNAQLMANRLYAILASQESKAVIRLPPPTTQLPREKPLPKPRPQTRWEKFAAEKGIVKKKRSKMVWDEAAGQWAPRYGFGRANKQDDPLKTWLVPAKPGEDGSTDPFEAAAGKRGEARAKQKRQEERNRLEAAHAAGLTSRGKGAAAGAGGSLGSSILESNSSLDPAIFGDALLRDMAKLWIRTLDGRSGQRRRPSPALLAAARQWQTSQEQQRRRRQQQQQQQQQRRPAPDPAAPPPAHAENPRCWHKCSLGGEIRVLALSTEAGFAEVHAAACAKFGVSEDWRLLCRDAADAADERGADPPLITLLAANQGDAV
ncbi:hypothetical protein EMIHUDRAFT_123316 [Emiliania huxleyi CCMP1516]|uniref:Ribosome biogenesis regulatory protein n=2 Tax=Emiliania huxleyi TaxID=2903 RepID=A0A0D3JXL6_EMIH1|nr:hypothetical protein EMIHUDRAFT_123316 [Emiliania huxleyi CCMP1516]EOD28251.1 hypothetical protein EMIHUDRAFT_123316 [Emiliania huxleyi CCMP1516]|eukprot:XP_005780680.1 hypothetical protein EMIHUDRAFT_123316 [Emiliania huxleyi CCMP1516]